MASEVEELKSRVDKLEGELAEVWNMLSALQDALGSEDFMGAAAALSHPGPSFSG
jgi:hypothetical protein